MSSYVSYTAIGGNIDAFLAKVAAAESQAQAHSEDAAYDNERLEPMIFEDVHALSQAHSKSLNDVLSACLQRASQQAYGDLLKSCLEVLLEFCALIGDLVSLRVEESKAVVKLGSLWERWRSKVSIFVSLDFILHIRPHCDPPGSLGKGSAQTCRQGRNDRARN